MQIENAKALGENKDCRYQGRKLLLKREDYTYATASLSGGIYFKSKPTSQELCGIDWIIFYYECYILGIYLFILFIKDGNIFHSTL